MLSPENVGKLFREYLDNLGQHPRTDATAIAELAATNAYLLYVSREMARNYHRGTSSEVLEEATKAEFLLLYLFGERSKLSGGRFNEWQQSLLLLGENTDPHFQFKNGRNLLSWAAEKGYEDIVKAAKEKG